MVNDNMHKLVHECLKIAALLPFFVRYFRGRSQEYPKFPKQLYVCKFIKKS